MKEINDYNSFSNLLFEVRDNDKTITFEEAEKLFKIAVSMSNKGHSEHSLTLLKKQLEDFGDNESKKSFGYGSNIFTQDIVKAIPESKDFFKDIDIINTETLKKYNDKKNELIQYIDRASKYYEEIVNNQKKSNSKEKILLKELKLYLENNK